MVNRIHLIFILEEVVFMDVLDLEFVVLSAACLNAIAVIENLKRMFFLLVAARAHRLHVVVTKDVITLSQHVGQLKLTDIKHVSP